MTTFFGFALADSMFVDGTITRTTISFAEAKAVIASGITSCCNPSHAATISAAKERYGISVDIPGTPPKVLLQSGDSLLVMGVRGLGRLTDRHEYTADEISSATFNFTLYEMF